MFFSVRKNHPIWLDDSADKNCSSSPAAIPEDGRPVRNTNLGPGDLQTGDFGVVRFAELSLEGPQRMWKPDLGLLFGPESKRRRIL
jgi:hypothetical protein